jgi:hypothetical protein
MARLSRREILFGASIAMAAPMLLTPKRASAASSAAQYPIISVKLKRKLAKIVPSIDHHRKYYPCLATLIDDIKLDCVYLIEADAYVQQWANSGRTVLSLDRVTDIEESPSRLPPKLADKLYRSGESGMGYHVFTIVFDDGSRLPCRTGDAVDFVEMPNEFAGRKIVNALPHVGRKQILDGAAQGRNAAYFWCPFRFA